MIYSEVTDKFNNMFKVQNMKSSLSTWLSKTAGERLLNHSIDLLNMYSREEWNPGNIAKDGGTMIFLPADAV